MPPETQFFAEVYLPSKTMLSESEFRAILGNERIRDLSLKVDDVVGAFLRSAKTQKDAFESIIVSYCESNNKKRPGEKSPSHINFVDTLLSWFPEAHVICIVRDGRDVASSLMNVPWSHNNIVKHSFDWCVTQSLARRLMEKFPENFFLLRYEDFVKNPEANVRDICYFIHEDFQPGMLESGTADTIPTWEAEWKSKAASAPILGNSNKWHQRSVIERSIMNVIMARSLAIEGYDVKRQPRMIWLLAWLICWPFHPTFRPYFYRLKMLGRSK